MFTQKISMDCTKEQYEKYLKEELLKMGYKEHYQSWKRDIGIFTNACDGISGGMLDICEFDKEKFNRHYLGSFNAPLFLALAAMTDKAEGNYGEYFIGKYSGDFYIMNDAFRRYIHLFNVRKATKEEIMAKFGENGSNTYNVEDYKDRINSVIFNFGKLATQRFADKLIKDSKEQLDAINLLKSKGYKILKPKTWEEV